MKENKQFLPKQMQYKYFNSCSNANLPYKYWDKNISDFIVGGSDNDETKINKAAFKQIKNYVGNMRENIENGRGLYIWGPTRVGKSLLATIVLKIIGNELKKLNSELSDLYGDDYIKYENNIYFVQATALYKYYFRSTCSETEKRIAQCLPQQRALVIDDIGKLEYAPGDLKVFMFDDLIRYRQLSGLLTIYTSNTPLDDMPKLLNESIYEIIKETCDEVVFVGDPFHSREV